MLRPSPFLMRAPFRCSSKNPEIAVTNLCLQAAMARSLRLKLLLARRLVGSTMGVTRGKSLSLREAMAKTFNLPRAKAVTPRSKAAILEVRCGTSIKGMLFSTAMRIQNAELWLGSNREKIPILVYGTLSPQRRRDAQEKQNQNLKRRGSGGNGGFWGL